MNLEKAHARGNQAAELLMDPLMVEAKAHIEAELWKQFQTLAPSDAEGLMFVKGMQYLHEKYFAFLSRAVADGKLARIEIERKKKTLKERVFG
jgi:hypothetical protein